MRKKLLTNLIALSVVAQLFVFTAYAATPNVSLANVAGKQGETIDVAVTLSDVTGFDNIGIAVEYNAAVFTLENAELNTISGVQAISAKELTANPYQMIFNASVGTVYYNGRLALLKFKIADDAALGSYAINISYYKGPNNNAVDGVNVNYIMDNRLNVQPINLTYTNATIQVKESAHSFSSWTKVDDNTHTRTCGGCGDVETEAHTWDLGTITVPATPAAAGTKTYTCTKCSATKEESIEYSEAFIIGDITWDGIVDRRDLLRMAKHFSGLEVQMDARAADVNGDGTFNATDLLHFARYFSGFDVILGE